MSNAYDSVCRIMHKTSSMCEGAMGVILYSCVGEGEGEGKREKEERIIQEKESERDDIRIYTTHLSF